MQLPDVLGSFVGCSSYMSQKHGVLFLFTLQVQMAVDVKFVQDTLKGDGVTEIRMKFIRRIEDNLPAGEE